MKTTNMKYILLVISLLLTIGISAQETDSLKYYLRIAAENNPGVKADFLAYQAALQKIPQAGAYEDPKLDIGFFFEPMDIVGGKQVADFTIMQMFPWFGSKGAAQKEATHMAKATFETFRESRDNKFFEIYSQWYILNNLQQKLKNIEENRNLLLQLRDLAMRKFASPSASSSTYTPSTSTTSSTSSSPAPTSASSSTGGGMSGMGGMGGGATSGSTASAAPMASMGGMSGGGGGMGSSSSGMSEVLRIELEIIELESNMETTLSEMRTEKAKFNLLLNRSSDSPLTIPATFAQVDFLFDGNTMERIKANSPMLEMLNQEGKAYKAMGEMNKKMSYPMFGVGFQYMLNKKTNDPMFAMGDMNGKDMIMPMVSISIPIYRNKYKAQQKESKIWWNANREKYTNTVNTLEAELIKSKHQLEDALRKIALYEKQTQLAVTTYNLATKEFEVGRNDLTNIIQVQRQLLDYQLKKADAIASYNTMVASIQKLVSFSIKE